LLNSQIQVIIQGTGLRFAKLYYF